MMKKKVTLPQIICQNKGNLMLKRILFILIVSTIFQPVSGKSSRETISFVSANPFGFRDVMSALDKQDEQEVFGYLTFPEKSGKFITTHPEMDELG